jgi:hypothetical protein
MDTLQLSLVLVASVWAGMNTLIAGYNAVNHTRDRILTGCTDEGISLTLEHRRLMYRNDWLPLKLGLAVVFLGFGCFLVFLPELAEQNNVLRLVCYIAALLPFGGFLAFFVLGLRDRAHIVEVLATADAAPDP